MNIIDHTRLYLSLGFSVLPLHFPVRRGEHLVCSCGKADCRQPAKHPVGRLVSRGLLNARRDSATVEDWFSNTTYTIGIATGAASGIVALDIDPRHDGHETLAGMEKHHGPRPPTRRFLTGGGGEHILFRHPGGKIANSAGALGPGIDVRGDGGYIVAPPSVHICGRPYAISVDHHPDEVPPADMPKWLHQQLVGGKRCGQRQQPTRRNWRTHVVETYGEGRRNDAVARLAGHLLRARVDPHVCLMLIIAWNRLNCLPPLDDDEVKVTVRSIAAREVARREHRHAR